MKDIFAAMKREDLIGYTLAIAGVLLFSTKAVLVKLVYAYNVPAVDVLLLRMVFSLPFYVATAFMGQTVEKIKRKDYAWLIALGMVGYYLASWFDFQGLKYISAGLERLILFTYPTLVLGLSYLFFQKKVSKQQLYGVLITYVGIAIVFSSELGTDRGNDVWLGGGLILLSALTYASYLIGSGWLIPKFGARLFTAYAMIVSCLCVAIHYLITSEGTITDYPSEVYILCLAMALFATVVPSFLISYAIKSLGANRFSVFGSLGPISTILLAYIFLDEVLSVYQMLGAAVVIMGIVLAEKKAKQGQ